ncbi:MAG: hypothetical protein OEZ22_04850 [Spirochaetia bacterium]|nr:hypothetical protein [Spirochaetia bacterium]
MPSPAYSTSCAYNQKACAGEAGEPPPVPSASCACGRHRGGYRRDWRVPHCTRFVNIRFLASDCLSVQTWLFADVAKLPHLDIIGLQPSRLSPVLPT